jgi:hypothetical protein
MHVLVEGLAAEGLTAEEGIPDHDAAKRRVVLVLEHQLAGLGELQIARAGGLGGAGQTDEDLGVLAGGLLDVVRPVQKVVVLGSGAARVVVELNKESIEDAFLDDGLHLEPLVGQGALGRRREQKLLAVVQLDEATSKSVSYVLLVHLRDILTIISWPWPRSRFGPLKKY